MKWCDNTALTIVIIGAINWLLVGVFRFDLVAFLFGNLTWLSRIVYTIVGLCGLYLISLYGRIGSMQKNQYKHDKEGSRKRALSSILKPMLMKSNWSYCRIIYFLNRLP